MTYKIGTLVALSCFTAAVYASDASVTDDVRTQIQALRAEQADLIARQERIDAALRALEAKLASPPGSTPGATPSGSPPISPSPAPAPTSVASAKSRLEVSGDLRVRGQGDYSDRDGKDRNSAQLRGRLGATFAANDRITLGARLATGDGDDPNSTDVQLSNFDDDLQVSLDLAYVQLDLTNTKLYGGKMPMPFVRTDLVWDSDVKPQGLSGVYRRPLANGGAFRASSLYFLIDEQAAGPESAMLGGQVGYDSPALGNWKYDVSAAYFDYRLGSTAGGDAGDFRSNLRDIDGRFRSDFNLGDFIVGATWNGFGERWPVRVVGDYVKNFGAATAADTGYGVDLIFGRTSKPGDWRVTYGHSIAQTDSVFAAFSHDNLSIATNYRLDALTFDYVPFSKTTLSAIWYHYKPYNAADAGTNDPADTLDRLRLYFQVSF
jgi:hypothetical protein